MNLTLQILCLDKCVGIPKRPPEKSGRKVTQNCRNSNDKELYLTIVGM